MSVTSIPSTEFVTSSKYVKDPLSLNFQALPIRAGSVYTERIEYTPEFLATAKFTEAIAALPLNVQSSLGTVAAQFILDCTFNEQMCTIER